MEQVDAGSGGQSVRPRMRRSPEQWRGLVQGQPSSGLSIEEYCQRQQIASSCFYRWRRFFTGSTGAQSPWCKPGKPSMPAVGGFASVRVVQDRGEAGRPPTLGLLAAPAGESIRLMLAGGRELRLPISMPTQRLVELLLGLENRSWGQECGA